MTFLELCQRLRQEVGAAGVGPAAVKAQHGEAARLISWISQAWTEIQTEHRDWRFAWAMGEVMMEDGYRDYPLPNDFGSFIPETIYLGDRRLTLLPYRIFRQRFRKPTVQEPKHLTVTPDDTLRTGGVLSIDGIPDENDALTFEYYRKPQVLAENGDVPRLPEEYHMLIVYQAMIQYGLYENAGEVVQQGSANTQRILRLITDSELPDMTLPGALA